MPSLKIRVFLKITLPATRVTAEVRVDRAESAECLTSAVIQVGAGSWQFVRSQCILMTTHIISFSIQLRKVRSESLSVVPMVPGSFRSGTPGCGLDLFLGNELLLPWRMKVRKQFCA